MPNEFQFELAFNADWVRQCLNEDAESLVVVGKISCNGGENDIVLKGRKADGSYLQYAVKGCPMPCQPPSSGGSPSSPSTN